MYIEVLVEITNKNVDKTFCYYVSDEYSSLIKKGIRVEVPFQNRTLEGFVLKILDKKPSFDTKEIIRVIDEEVILTEELLSLGLFLKKKTLSSLITCYQAMLPKALKAKNNVTISKKMTSYLSLIDDKYVPQNEKQKEIISLLKEGEVLKSEVVKISTSGVKTLINKKVILDVEKEVYRKIHNSNIVDKHSLTPHQQEALEMLENTSKIVTLLHGVTGSGKTEIYMELIEKQINIGKTVIILVPEISLTEQIVSRFLMRFERVAVLHSKLSEGEKYDEYRRIAKGEVDIVIGARSAIFAPLKNIGLIIIDEEQSSSFKQDNNPRYRAIDVALERMKYHNGRIILGSATPSIDTYARALKGVYALVKLEKRVNDKDLPKVCIVDMSEEVKKKNTIFSDLLHQKIEQHLKENHQILLLLNRRGYSSFISCKNCGYVVKCPNCDITLTYHKTNNILRCHYCGYAEAIKKTCPSCSNESLSTLGMGTEKVEEKINELFKDAKVLRMDLDTTSKKGAHEKIITSFKNYEADILLGTQIIAKGLDFPNVSLVGVINADTSLNIPDFRSGEDTFQLLCQVAGRSGRGSVEGEVVIQTFNPDHYAIDFAKNHDYLGFFKKEMEYRKTLGYPPYYYLTTLLISSPDYEKCRIVANQIGLFLKKELTTSKVLGPTPAGIMKINNIYRFQIIIKYKKEDKLYQVLKYLDNHYKSDNKIRLDIDFSPSHF